MTEARPKHTTTPLDATPARRLPDVKQIRDMAAALQQYAKQQQYSLEVQNDAAELKLRAERKAGTMLAEMGLQGGDRKSKSQGVTLKLADLGIGRMDSHRWQQEAELKRRAERRAGELLHDAGIGRGSHRKQKTPEGFLPRLADLGIDDHQSSDWQLEAELKRRAERRAGELLAAIDPPSHAGRPQKNSSHDGRNFRLADMGITYNQSSRWQLESELSDAMFEAYITTTRRAPLTPPACDVHTQPTIGARQERRAPHMRQCSLDDCPPRGQCDHHMENGRPGPIQPSRAVGGHFFYRPEARRIPVTKRLDPGVPYANRQTTSIQFQINIDREAEAILRLYAGGSKSGGRFLERLLFEHHARVLERTRLLAAHPELAGAVAAGEETP